MTVSDTPAKLPENAAALVASMALTDVATMRLWPQALAKPQLSWSLQYAPESVSSQMPAESYTETWLPSPAASHLLFLLFLACAVCYPRGFSRAVRDRPRQDLEVLSTFPKQLFVRLLPTYLTKPGYQVATGECMHCWYASLLSLYPFLQSVNRVPENTSS